MDNSHDPDDGLSESDRITRLQLGHLFDTTDMEFEDYFDLTTGAQIEIPNELEIHPADAFIRGSTPFQIGFQEMDPTFLSMPSQLFQNRLLPSLDDLLGIPLSASNLSEESVVFGEMIHDGSEFDVPSVLDDVGLQSITFTGQEEEVCGNSLRSSIGIEAPCPANQANADDGDKDDLNESLSSNKISIQQRNQFYKLCNLIEKKVELMNARTGTACFLNANLGSDSFEIGEPKSRLRHDSIGEGMTAGDNSDMEDELVSKDDHRYAAVILTQKVSSSSVTDHQYNEIPCTRPIREKSVEDKASCSKPKFIKKRYERERTLVSFLNFVFSKAQNLKAWTGASVVLKVVYEDHVFTEHNFAEAKDVLEKKRRTISRRNGVAPVPVLPDGQTTLGDEDGPFAFVVEKTKIGASGGTKYNIRLVTKNPTENSGNQESSSEFAPVSAPVSPKTPFNPISAAVESVPKPIPKLRRLDNHIEIPDHWYGEADTEYTLSPPESEQLNSSEIEDKPIIMLDSPQQSSPEIEIVKSTKEIGTSTNTEPVCTICSSSEPPSTSSRALLSTQTLWIRCFDPFCQNMVHPSCIGFRVTSSDCLRSLPPYFCAVHRLN